MLRVVGAAVVLLVLGVTGYLESQFFYWPDRRDFETPPGIEDMSFETSDGLTIHGWFVPARGVETSAAPTVLHVHGNAGHIAVHLQFSEFLAERGINVMLFDYRGFGRSDRPGRPMYRDDLLKDTRAAFDALLARPDIDPGRVSVYGYSLGGVLGLKLAAERAEVRSVVSLAAFSSWQRIASDKVPLLGWLLIRGGADAVQSIAELGARPVFLVHGRFDRTVPVSHARRLEAAAMDAGVPVDLHINDATHVSLFIDDPELPERIAGFIHRTTAVGPVSGSDAAPSSTPAADPGSQTERR